MGHRGGRGNTTQTRRCRLIEYSTQMLYWTAAPTTAEGPRKGEPSSSFMRYGPRPQPACLVRGSSRRIMTMRFRPANIRVINRRVCSSAVIRLLSKTKTQCSKLTSGNVFPPTPPVEVWSMPERCSPSRVRCAAPKLRRAPDGCAPFRPDEDRDGRLRREHSAALHQDKNAGSLAGAGLIQRKSVRRSQGLTGSLHIKRAASEQTATAAG